jgi:hypothetical protein
VSNLRSPLNLALLAILIAITVWGYLDVPLGLDLPVHWGLDGSVTTTMPRNWALAQMPIACAIVWGVFYLIATSGTAARRRSTAVVLAWGLPILTALFAAVELVIVLIGLGVAVPFFHAT